MQLDKEKFDQLVGNIKDAGISAINWGLNNPEKVMAGFALGTRLLNAMKHLQISHRNNVE